MPYSLRLSGFFFALGIFLSTIYVFESGLPQPGHIMLLVASLLLFFSQKKIVVPKKYLLQIGLFVFYCSLINLFYAVYFQDADFLKPSLFLIYNSIIFFAVFQAIKNNILSFKALVVTFFCAASLQLLLFFSGTGRTIEGVRFYGLFNDPNQMAYWFICMLATVFFVAEQQSKKNILLSVFLVIFAVVVIMLSASRSGLLGLLPFVIYVAIQSLKAKSIVNRGFKLFLFALCALIFSLAGIETAVEYANEDVLIERLKNTDFSGEAEIRGYNRIVDYPEMLVIGGGEGAHKRFNVTGVEIHSTWVGILFYYGVVGAFLFLFFLRGALKDKGSVVLLLFFAPVFYGLATYGLRTPIFWIMLAGLCSVKRKI
tara:strand:- start:4085 stop:5194 length:1110 start_codon:yes stop_codon:yes gene_type:complete